ncbi:MAG: hypothetical protein B0A82_02025 [Alkalinema sp. CACIAM 70d]|nr:MAG: hypothetical protein B0A82_02025 [Alkalinema sp. CACIAM 70d]
MMQRTELRISLAALVVAFSTGLSSVWTPSAIALPGQSTDEVATWLRSTPSLKPGPGEKLTVRRSNTASQRMIFEASMFAPGKLTRKSASGGVVRSESLQLFDMLYGVTKARLEEALRSIYGLEITQDYEQAEVVYSYPTAQEERNALRQNKPIAAALQGELRRGRRFAYWIEVARNPTGLNYAGKIVVFLNEDLAKVESDIQSR